MPNRRRRSEHDALAQNSLGLLEGAALSDRLGLLQMHSASAIHDAESDGISPRCQNVQFALRVGGWSSSSRNVRRDVAGAHWPKLLRRHAVLIGRNAK